ncbi:MAG: NUDIX domain-containing protein [Clostridia bacterium]|nr:NUDIX domain-containing protein [Clostridia bacterium]
MEVKRSCGAVVYTQDGGTRKYVIIRSIEGFCGFPKGHVEKGETDQMTALREIKEETGLYVTLIDGFQTMDEHPHIREGRPPVMKQMVYFLAEFHGQTPQPQLSEVSEILLMTYEEAMAVFEYESTKRILTEARDFLENANK